MLEFLINFREVNDRPYVMFLWAFILTSVAVVASSQIYYTIPVGASILNLSGLMSILFVIIPAAYFLTVLIKKEEILEEKRIAKHSRSFWRRHEKDMVIMLYFFFGVVFSFAVWTMLLPSEFFQVQATKINQIRGIGQVAGLAVDKEMLFQNIFFNNLQVMVFAFVLSLVFGAGAVFILVWNASILGVYIGQISKQLWHIPLVSLNFLPHGIPEVAAYVAAALAGGLISTAVLRRTKWEILKVVLFDALKILAVALVLVTAGAGIEAYF